MAVYIRTAGDHVAERVKPEPGSDDAARLEELVADLASGWRVEDAEVAELEGPFDPGEHSVTDVMFYLAEVDADEAERVLAAEEVGKARKGVLVARETLASLREEE